MLSYTRSKPPNPLPAPLLMRWRGARAKIAKVPRIMFEGVAGIVQVSTYGASLGDTFDFVGLVESAASIRRRHFDPSLFCASAHAIDIVNVYPPSWKRSE